MIRSLRDVALAACISFMVVLALSYSSLANLWEVNPKDMANSVKAKELLGGLSKPRNLSAQKKIS